MEKKENKQDTRPLIFEALSKITQEVEAIKKEKTNAMQGYKFRGIDDVYNTLHNLYGKYGVTIIPEVVSSAREERATQKGGLLIYSIIDYKFTFYALDGSNVSAIVKGEGMDSSDKSSNKSFSASLKYALMSIHLIPTQDLIDADKDNPEPAPKKEEIKKPERDIQTEINACKDIKELNSLYKSLTTEEKTEHLTKFTPKKTEFLNSKINDNGNGKGN